VPPPELNAFLTDDIVEADLTQGPDGRWNASALALIERVRVELCGEVVAHRGELHLRLDREVANTDWPLDEGGVAVAPGRHVVAKVAPGQPLRARPGRRRPTSAPSPR
jgi:ribonuclease R